MGDKKKLKRELGELNSQFELARSSVLAHKEVIKEHVVPTLLVVLGLKSKAEEAKAVRDMAKHTLKELGFDKKGNDLYPAVDGSDNVIEDEEFEEPHPSDYDEHDNLTLFGKQVYVDVDGYTGEYEAPGSGYNVYDRDTGNRVNAEDVLVPANMLVWVGRYNPHKD